MALSGLYNLVGRVPYLVNITDAVSQTLGDRGRLAGYAGIILGAVANSGSEIEKLAAGDVTLMDKGYYLASLAVPLALYLKGAQLLSSPLPVLTPKEVKLLKTIVNDISREGSPSDTGVAKLFNYAFANERFSKRLEMIMEHHEPALVAKFHGYLEPLYHFSSLTVGLTPVIMEMLKSKMEVNAPLKLSELIYIAHLSEIHLKEDVIQCLGESIRELIVQSKTFIGSSNLGLHNASVGSILVQNSNKYGYYENTHEEGFFNINTFGHSFVLCDNQESNAQAIDITYDGIQIKSKKELRSTLCMEVLSLDFQSLVTSQMKDKFCKEGISEEQGLAIIESIYQQKIQALSQFHIQKPHQTNMKNHAEKRLKKSLDDLNMSNSLDLGGVDNPSYLRCPGPFNRFYGYFNKFTLNFDDSDRGRFDVGQPVTCGAFSAKLVEQAVRQTNEQLQKDYALAELDNPFVLMQSPFPSYMNLDTLDPSDFIDLDTFKPSDKQFGTIKIIRENQ